LHSTIKDIRGLKDVMGHNEQEIPKFNSKFSRKVFEDQIKNTLMFRFDLVDVHHIIHNFLQFAIKEYSEKWWNRY